MVVFFYNDKRKILIIRIMTIICGLFLLVACGTSRTEKNCADTAKENSDMTSEMSSAARNAPPLNAQIPAPAGQETAIFGMG
jgi:uncharacterized lipoprotein YajG